MIENELKYVLDLSVFSNMHRYPHIFKNFRLLTQGYHKSGGRFREEVSEDGIGFRTFNYKVPLPDGQLEEFEQEISKDSFDRCIALCDNKLIKTRYTTSLNDLYLWDIDFFQTEIGDVYFIMAECEMPPSVKKPEYMLSIVEDYCIYEVPRFNSEFTSKSLADRAYAESMLEKIKKW